MIVSEDIIFEGKSYVEGLHKKSFDNCTFSKCNFSDSKLIACTFTDCSFIDCNLSMVELNQSTLNNIHFKNCKMLGVKFNHCHDFIFHVDFENCILDYACLLYTSRCV